MLGPQCCANPPILNPASGAGQVEMLGGLNSYVTGPSLSLFAIILVSDVYGFEAPNLRNLADKIATSGFYVVVPDFFHGEPFNPNNPNRPKEAWLKDHGPDKGFEDAKPLIQALKKKGVSAIGAAGFCWGGKVAVQLAKPEFTQAAVLLHPSFVTVDDIKVVEVPIAILGAELDHVASPAVMKQFEEVLDAKPELDSYVKVFPKVAHGWAIRYNVTDKNAVKRAKEAHKILLEWFIQHVKGKQPE